MEDVRYFAAEAGRGVNSGSKEVFLDIVYCRITCSVDKVSKCQKAMQDAREERGTR